jgi:peptidoglycan/LPS O-acetylase OafA/YrhL
MHASTSPVAAKYRPDIDGLRAIAVLSVVLFHFKLGPFEGGFVGVDIFFVISGYLIAGIIRDEMTRGAFTFAGFYERRIRRILPALGVVLLATAIAGAAILLPTDLRRLGDSTVATALFGSNFYFWRNTGYFDPGHDFNLLLHTWSLAVEEQYYMLFPVILFLLTRYRRDAAGVVIAGITLASFAACVILQAWRPDAVFYLLPFRMWELLAGAWLAVAAVPRAETPVLREGLAAAGLLLIVAGVLLISPGAHFPGWVAAVPVLGTVLVIHAGSGGPSLAGQLLSLRPMVAVGLISYSLYLWHWPVVVLARYRQGGDLSVGTAVALLALTIGLSYLTYRYVEKPLRRRRGPGFSGRQAIGTATAAVVSGVALGLTLSASQGWTQRFAPDVVALDDDRTAAIPFMACNDRTKFYEASRDITSLASLCRIGKEGGTPAAILWGDSHALAWAPGIDALFRQQGITGVIAIKAECPPLEGLVDRRDGRCGEFNEQVRGLVEAHGEIRLVVLGAAWPSYVTPADPSRLADGSDAGGGWDFGRVFDRTVAGFEKAGKRVWVLGPTPRAPEDPAFGLALAGAYDVPPPPATPTATVRATAQSFWEAVSKAPPRSGLLVSDPADWLCDGAACRYAHDGLALYRDGGHLNVRGALYLLPNLQGDLAKIDAAS